MFITSRNMPMHSWMIWFCVAGLALHSPGEMSGWVAAAEKQGAGKKAAMFWHKKGIKEWSPQEVQLFLQDSPWAKTQRVTVSIKNVMDPKAPQSPAVAGAVRMMRFESCCRTFEVPMAGSNTDSDSSSQGVNSTDSARESNRAWSFTARVFWFSSVSIRHAMIRQRQLQGIPMEQSEAALAPSNDFVLALSGSFLRLLQGLALNEVRRISSLAAARGTKRQLAPAEYIPAQSDADPMAFLIFPKSVAGEPVFSLGDGSLTFSMRGADFELECQFPLEPMVVEGKLDW